ncbi:hypothetical protein SeMB42_g07913 [Synchytrium endobioticum]|uniref:Uncharacterized protein n=1 Tax=Synchytrium endobioticum TaxID=286115 RepID=A0A507BTW9_9FUNG|nr:hypothetical protein SeMB42_g07913 [Synchytrium endobioticum]TPX34981.1 hypothetical protein SeLEV6574_g08225 [Synchytrium endobioticum]
MGHKLSDDKKVPYPQSLARLPEAAVQEQKHSHEAEGGWKWYIPGWAKQESKDSLGMKIRKLLTVIDGGIRSPSTR